MECRLMKWLESAIRFWAAEDLEKIVRQKLRFRRRPFFGVSTEISLFLGVWVRFTYTIIPSASMKIEDVYPLFVDCR